MSNFVIKNGVLEKYLGYGRDVIIPEGVTKIGVYAFSDCENLQSVVIPEGVTKIGDSAFSGCKNLQSVVIPEGVTKIGGYAFSSCKNLQSIVIPESITEIGHFAFSHCKNLQSIVIPEGVTKIGDGAFYCCENLQSLDITNGNAEIDENAFVNCVRLANKDGFLIIGGVLYNYYGNRHEVSIPEGVKKIISRDSFGHEGAFCNRSDITVIRVPESVEKIKGTPFYGFSNLKQMYIAQKSIGDNMFGFSGKTIELILTEGGKEEKHVIGSFRKEYYTQIFNIKKDCLLPIGEDLADYDKLVACGKYEGFNMNDDGRLQAMLFRLSDKENPVAAENAEFFVEFLSQKIIKAINYAESRNEPAYVEILRDIGAIPENKKKRIAKQLAASENEAIRQLADKLDERVPFVFGGNPKNPEEILPNIDMKFIEQIKKIQAKALLMRNGIEELPDVLLKESGEIAPKEYLILILAEYVKQGKDADYIISEIADEAAKYLDKTSLEKAVYIVFKRSLERMEFVLPIARFGDGATVSKLYREYKGKSWSKDFAKRFILLSDTREAMFFADKDGYLSRYALMRKTDADTLRESFIYDFGFDENGVKELDLGTKKINVIIDSDLSLSVTDLSTGKSMKSIPKKGSDDVKYQEAKAVFAEMKKNIKKAVNVKCATILPDFLSGKERTAGSWKNSYTKNPLLHKVATLLVWKQGNSTFTLNDSGAITSDGAEYVLSDKPVSVAHPMEMNAGDLHAWQKYFVSHGLKQPFEQVWEPVIDPSSVKEDRYGGCMIPYYRFLGREKHGITVQDFDYHDDIMISFNGCSADIERIDWERHSIDMNDRFEVKTFSFKKYSRMINHIVAYLDKITAYDRIAKDDISVESVLPGFTLAQITEFIKIAQENNATNVTALLLNYKNENFADFDPMAEFTLD